MVSVRPAGPAGSQLRARIPGLKVSIAGHRQRPDVRLLWLAHPAGPLSRLWIKSVAHHRTSRNFIDLVLSNRPGREGRSA